LFSCIKAEDFSILLSTSTIRNTMLSFPLNDCFNSLMDGISRIHGGHHVAQKLINTTLPFRELNVTVLPSPPLKEISEVSAGASTFATSSVGVFPSVVLFPLFLNGFPQAASQTAVTMKIPEQTANFLNCIFILNDFFCFLILLTLILVSVYCRLKKALIACIVPL